MGEGFSQASATSFSLFSEWIKTPLFAADDVMAQKRLKAASLGNPISGSLLSSSLIVVAEQPKQFEEDCELFD